MKKTFDEICNEILKENNSDTNPVSTVPNTQATSVIAGGSTTPEKPTTPNQTPQPTATPKPNTQEKTAIKPDDIINTLAKIKDHPEFVKVIGSAIEQLSKNQQQKTYNNQQANAAQQPA